MRAYFAVFVGACLGGGVRVALDSAVETVPWAWDIVIINLLGSALLGALAAWFAGRSAWWIPGLGPGLLGGFTTFSALAAPHPTSPLGAAALLAATMLACTLAAAAGWRSAAAVRERRATS